MADNVYKLEFTLSNGDTIDAGNITVPSGSGVQVRQYNGVLNGSASSYQFNYSGNLFFAAAQYLATTNNRILGVNVSFYSSDGSNVLHLPLSYGKLPAFVNSGTNLPIYFFGQISPDVIATGSEPFTIGIYPTASGGFINCPFDGFFENTFGSQIIVKLSISYLTTEE